MYKKTQSSIDPTVPAGSHPQGPSVHARSTLSTLPLPVLRVIYHPHPKHQLATTALLSPIINNNINITPLPLPPPSKTS